MAIHQPATSRVEFDPHLLTATRAFRLIRERVSAAPLVVAKSRGFSWSTQRARWRGDGQCLATFLPKSREAGWLHLQAPGRRLRLAARFPIRVQPKGPRALHAR